MFLLLIVKPFHLNFHAIQYSFSFTEVKEVAFVYALASAAVVHTVAQSCAKNADKFHYCGCDKAIVNKELADGERWGGCSPDIHFSVNFAKMFIDRIVGNATLQHQTFVLHNTRIGRLVSTSIHLVTTQTLYI